MKYPDLVPKAVCNIPCIVKIYNEKLDTNGSPTVDFEGNLLCNYQDKARTIITNEKKAVLITGTAYFHSDFCPDISNITDGEIILFGKRRRIIYGAKARNLDGTVNFIEIGVE